MVQIPGRVIPAGGEQCSQMSAEGGIPPGRACRDSGGILDPNQSCSMPAPENIQKGFSILSAHYVSPLWINDEEGQSHRSIAYRSSRADFPWHLCRLTAPSIG